jgi:hypothetical protein
VNTAAVARRLMWALEVGIAINMKLGGMLLCLKGFPEL